VKFDDQTELTRAPWAPVVPGVLCKDLLVFAKRKCHEELSLKF
jgi:hypothetical protein